MANTTTEKETQSQIKLRIILHSRSSSMPRKEFVLYVPRSHNQKREPSHLSDISDTEYSSVTKTETTRVIAEKDSRKDVPKMWKSGGNADKCGGLVKEKWRVSKKKKPLDKRDITKDSRSVYEEKCERKGVNNSCSKKMKMSNVITHEVEEEEEERGEKGKGNGSLQEDAVLGDIEAFDDRKI
ncbi:hypothetical protein TanjilG_08466 [Lupinus angustifolius]|uniref:Uncharacterized protein n=1 Tax=Lupinus angustifolius TaxID=3871 RepID=A0A1J7I442_LUPAN|nr:hypothetical protein TanjilG_08466 [Lupinus angustifolius]